VTRTRDHSVMRRDAYNILGVLNNIMTASDSYRGHSMDIDLFVEQNKMIGIPKINMNPTYT